MECNIHVHWQSPGLATYHPIEKRYELPSCHDDLPSLSDYAATFLIVHLALHLDNLRLRGEREREHKLTKAASWLTESRLQYCDNLGCLSQTSVVKIGSIKKSPLISVSYVA